MRPQMTRRAFLGRIAVVAGGAVLAGCTQAPAAPTTQPQPAQSTEPAPTAVSPPAEPAKCDAVVQLRCTHSWPATQWPRQVEFDNMFNKDNPCVQMTGENVVWGDYIPKITTGAAAGTLPDVMYVQFAWAQQFLLDGVMIDLQPFLENDQEFWGENGEDFVPVSLVSYTWQGDLYAIPYNEGPTNLLYYNLRLFDEAGVPYPNSDKDWTLDDLLDAATKLTRGEGENKIWGFGGGTPWMGGDLNADFLYTWGARWWNEPCETESHVHEPRAIECLQWWLDLIHKYKVAPSEAELGTIEGNAFAMGRVAMTRGASWSNRSFKPVMKDTYDVTHHCIGPNGKRSTSTMGSAYAISKDCKHTDAAWQYMRSYLSTEGQIFNWSSIGIDPARWSAWPAYFTSGSAPEGAKCVTDAMDTYAVHDVLDSPNASEIDMTANAIWEKAVIGEMSVQEACTQITPAVADIMKKNEEWCRQRGA